MSLNLMTWDNYQDWCLSFDGPFGAHGAAISKTKQSQKRRNLGFIFMNLFVVSGRGWTGLLEVLLEMLTAQQQKLMEFATVNPSYFKTPIDFNLPISSDLRHFYNHLLSQSTNFGPSISWNQQAKVSMPMLQQYRFVVALGSSVFMSSRPSTDKMKWSHFSAIYLSSVVASTKEQY